MKKKILLITLATIIILSFSSCGCGKEEIIENSVNATVVSYEARQTYATMSAHADVFKLSNGYLVACAKGVINLNNKYEFKLRIKKELLDSEWHNIWFVTSARLID